MIMSRKAGYSIFAFASALLGESPEATNPLGRTFSTIGKISRSDITPCLLSKSLMALSLDSK